MCPHKYHTDRQGVELVPCAYDDDDVPIIKLLGGYIDTTNSTRLEVNTAVITKTAVL
jgi:hypothetical protein